MTVTTAKSDEDPSTQRSLLSPTVAVEERLQQFRELNQQSPVIPQRCIDAKHLHAQNQVVLSAILAVTAAKEEGEQLPFAGRWRSIMDTASPNLAKYLHQLQAVQILLIFDPPPNRDKLVRPMGGKVANLRSTEASSVSAEVLLRCRVVAAYLIL